MKRKLFICSLAAIVLSLAAFGTTAYFSNENNAKNVITAGDIEISVLEASAADDNKGNASYEKAVAVMPHKTVSKITYIKNTGGKAAWVRVSVNKTIEFAEKVDGKPDISLIELNFNTENWQEKDGYFYYLKKLKSGEATEPLFTTVTFSKEMKNKYQDSTATVDIKAQAVQTDNNGATVFEAAGWQADK